MAIDIAAVGSNLEQVISAIGIPLIGRTLSKDLAYRFKSYEEFRNSINNGFDFSRIDGYGPEMTKAILTFDYSEIDNLINSQIIKIVPYKEEVKENNLEGLVFVITGKLNIYKNRDAIKKEIEARGGKVSGSISRKTNYLINNDLNSTSSKNKFAQEHDIPIISEENFINIFDI
jgi:DNA ligase (NAD+)